MNLKPALLNCCMREFLQQFHQDVMEHEASLFWGGFVQTIKRQYPEVWQGFQRYVQETYRSEFVAEYLPEVRDV